MGISPRTVDILRSLGHDVVRLNEVSLNQAADSDVIAYGVAENRVILTFDLDYPLLLVLTAEKRTSTVVFRTSSADPDWINSRLQKHLALVETDLTDGAIVIVEDDRVRVRRFNDIGTAGSDSP